MNREPALVIAAIAALINVAVGFGLEWTAEQVTLVNVAVVAVAALITRNKVTPV